jgi:hypothetical protein
MRYVAYVLCVMCQRKGNCAGFWWGSLREREHLEKLGVYGMMILKWVFK